MSWWKRGFSKSGSSDRIVPTHPVDVSPVANVPSAPLRPLNDLDRDAIRKLEETFTKAGVVGEKGEPINVAARIDDILEKVAEQGSSNANELLGDRSFDLEQFGEAQNENFLITEVDEEDFVTYDVYDPIPKGSEPRLEIEQSEDGSISFRLEDGTMVHGTRPTIE